MTPGGPTIMQMSVKTGIGHGSIRNWIKLYANPSSMKNLKEWFLEEKLEIIMKTFFMSENELGEFLRASGLHSTDIEQWKQDIYSSQRSVGRPKLDPELVGCVQRKKSSQQRQGTRGDGHQNYTDKKSQLLFWESEEDE